MIPFGMFRLPLTPLAFVSESHDTGASSSNLALPTGVTAGDLLLCYYRILSATDGTPSGWTQIMSLLNSAGARHDWFYRIATGSDSAMPGNVGGVGNARRAIFLFRGNKPITAVSVVNPLGEVTSGNPVAQVQPSNSGNVPMIVGASWVNDNLSVVSPRTMSPAKDNEVSIGSTGMYAGYRLINASLAGDTTVDMDDEGSENALTSFLLRVS